ncbi:hypothetical protein [Streptomyces beigongshangae]|uniref:hypothetical protein n=1 Tax=Streptomyces beigongshangae TaxID=2841597 RepID=UPI001C85733A|nr:hypothetical protein [Streptomyces sp. REN17]
MIALGLEAFIWYSWGTGEYRSLIAVLLAGVAAGLVAVGFTPELHRILLRAVPTVVVVVGLVLGGVRFHDENSDLGVTVRTKDAEDMADGDVATFTVPTPGDRAYLRLTLRGRDLPSGGSPCVFRSEVGISGGARNGEQDVAFDRQTLTARIPLRTGGDSVALRVELRTGPACRISLEPDEAILTNE